MRCGQSQVERQQASESNQSLYFRLQGLGKCLRLPARDVVFAGSGKLWHKMHADFSTLLLDLGLEVLGLGPWGVPENKRLHGHSQRHCSARFNPSHEPLLHETRTVASATPRCPEQSASEHALFQLAGFSKVGVSCRSSFVRGA